MDSDQSWLIVIVSLFGVLIAIVAFIRTPVSERYRMFSNAKSIDERLASYPESANAVLVKGNWKRAIFESFPFYLYALFAIAVSLYLRSVADEQCVHLFGINSVILTLALFCYAVPLGVLLISLLYLRTGIKAVQTGYFPAIDSSQLVDTIATKGLVSSIRGYVLVVMPIVSLGLVFFGYYMFSEFMGLESFQEFQAKIEGDCK